MLEGAANTAHSQSADREASRLSGKLTGTDVFKKQVKIVISPENSLKIFVSIFIRDLGM